MQIALNITLSVCIISLLAFSFRIIYSTIRFFNIAFAITITLSAYFSYFFAIVLDLNLFFSIFSSVIISIIIGFVIVIFIFRPLQKKYLENWQLLIASLGVYIILQNIISLIWGDSTLSFRTWEVKEGYLFLGAYITDVQIITIISCIVLLVFSWLFIEKTKVGQQIKAVSSNPQLSSYYGISTNKATLYSFALGSGLAACAGILIAADTDMTPTMGFNWLLYVVVAMIIGGMGKMRYLLLGALLLATAQHLSAHYLDSKWMNATAYIILIVFLYFKPFGFSGQKLKKQEV
mgnify:CR=1 FL=1